MMWTGAVVTGTMDPRVLYRPQLLVRYVFTLCKNTVLGNQIYYFKKEREVSPSLRKRFNLSAVREQMCIIDLETAGKHLKRRRHRRTELW